MCIIILFISEGDRQTLLDGKTVTKIGYEEHFDRNIMGVVIPVLENKKLVGIVYSYIPLKSIKDLIYDMGLILAPLAIAMILITIWVGRKNYNCNYEATFANGAGCKSFGYGRFFGADYSFFRG